MSKYDFNAERCQKAISSLSKMVYDNGYTAIPTRDKVLLGVILDDLIMDIEALHEAAQDRDNLSDALNRLSPTEIGYQDYYEVGEVDELTDHHYETVDGKITRKPRIEDLSL